jgi:hypothetical protein
MSLKQSKPESGQSAPAIASPTIAQMRQIARDRGGRCLSKAYVSATSHLLWECAQRHQWRAIPNNIKRGRWCPICARTKKRYGIEDMQQLAQAHGGRCLSDAYISSKTPLLWECERQHQWQANPNAIRNGAWCRDCANQNRRLTLDVLQRVARERGGRCLSDSYTTSSVPLLWECAQRHQWQALPSHVKNAGHWCPICARIDRRHSLEDMRDLAKQHGGECLSTHHEDFATPLHWRCAQGHTWQATGTSVQGGTWCRQCVFESRRGTLEQMQEIAFSKGGQCLSTAYVDSATHLNWRCAQGHTWQATPATISRRWCPDCGNERKRLGIEKMRELAAQRGGLCLSEIYLKNTTKLTWQCIDGHQWDANYANIRLGSWCPECFKIKTAKQRELNARKKKRRFSLPSVL